MRSEEDGGVHRPAQPSQERQHHRQPLGTHQGKGYHIYLKTIEREVHDFVKRQRVRKSLPGLKKHTDFKKKLFDYKLTFCLTLCTCHHYKQLKCNKQTTLTCKKIKYSCTTSALDFAHRNHLRSTAFHGNIKIKMVCLFYVGFVDYFYFVKSVVP